MFKKLVKAIKNPKKAWRFFTFMLAYNFRKRKGTLVIIGMESGGVFSLMHRGFEKCYCFEANPERFKQIEKKYKKFNHIELHNVAVAQYNGKISFNISSNNNGASSSIGNFNPDWKESFNGEQVEMIKSITVPCINLNDFCVKNRVTFIDEYLSDIQGMDLEVLKTIQPMINNKSIGSITCEVTKDDRKNIYSDLPDNSESGFRDLLEGKYKLIARGWGALRDNKFDKIPENSWEMDCKWRVK